MPTYDYECDACGHRFEELQSIKAEPLRKCPKCGKRRLRRLIGGGAGLIFRGSGFYATDYRNPQPAPKPEEGPKEEKKPEKPAKKETPKEGGSSSGGDKSCGSCGKTGPAVCD
jgi:putative FmdB family regulatory protein